MSYNLDATKRKLIDLLHCKNFYRKKIEEAQCLKDELETMFHFAYQKKENAPNI